MTTTETVTTANTTLKLLFVNDAKFGWKFETQNAIWYKQSLVTGFSSSEVLGLTDVQKTCQY